MFGYIHPDKPYLFIKDDTLYQAVYCGLCKSIGKECGQFARTSLTYDMAFMSALLHNILGQDFIVTKQRCVVHPFKRRPMAQVDDLTMLLGAINTALAYYKLMDDKADGDKKGVFAFLYRKGYKKTLQKYPKAVEIIKAQTDSLNVIEAKKSAVIDEACEPTAHMMRTLSHYVLGETATDATDGLCYALGKWIYLADALDDYDKDVKKGNYNVIYEYCKQPTKELAMQACGEEVKFIFNALFADMRDNLQKISFHFNHDLTDNIILRGIPLQSRRLFYGNTKKEKLHEQKKS